MLARLEPGEQRGSSSGWPKPGLRPPPGAQARSDRSRGLDRATDGGEPLRVRVEHPPRPVRRRGRAGDEVRGGDGVLGSTSGSSCAASAAAVSASSPPWTTTASRRSAIRGSDLDVELERRGADLGEPEAETPRRGRTRAGSGPGGCGARTQRLELDLLAGRDRPLEGDTRPVPDDRVAAVVEPVVGELHAGGSRASARSPCRRSAARPAPVPVDPARSCGSS